MVRGKKRIVDLLKRKLAKGRITKLIDFARTNDELMLKYLRDSGSIISRVSAAEQILRDGTPAGTLAGAQAKVARLNKYKTTEKGPIFSDHFKLESLNSSLTTRLSENKRPPFVCVRI